jgi:hypothetical protein
MVAMCPRVPAAVGDIDAAAERNRVVDDEDFLVAAPVGRMFAVHLEMEPP